LAFSLALWGSHIVRGWEAAHYRSQLVKGLKKAVGDNDYILNQVDHQINGLNQIPTFSMDLTFLSHANFATYQHIQSIEDCAAVDRLRFELMHLDIKLTELRRRVPGSAEFIAMRGSIVAHLPLVRQVLEDTRAVVNLL
jgi:hypothetical protein